MPLIEHLKELRVRLIRAVIAIAVGFAIAYVFVDQLFATADLAVARGLATARFC